MSDHVERIQAKLNAEYAAYRDRWTPWPADDDTRRIAMQERLDLDRRELAHIEEDGDPRLAAYRRRVVARITVSERSIPKE